MTLVLIKKVGKLGIGKIEFDDDATDEIGSRPIRGKGVGGTTTTRAIRRGCA